MNIPQMKTNEIALLLHSLRAIFVADQEEARQKLMSKLEEQLTRRGARLAA